MIDSNETGTPQPEADIELRKWAIEIALRATDGPMALIPCAEDVLRFVRAAEGRPMTTLKIGTLTEMWTLERAGKAIEMRYLGVGCSAIADVLDAMPGAKITTGYVRAKLLQLGVLPPGSPRREKQQKQALKMRAVRAANIAAARDAP